MKASHHNGPVVGSIVAIISDDGRGYALGQVVDLPRQRGLRGLARIRIFGRMRNAPIRTYNGDIEGEKELFTVYFALGAALKRKIALLCGWEEPKEAGVPLGPMIMNDTLILTAVRVNWSGLDDQENLWRAVDDAQ